MFANWLSSYHLIHKTTVSFIFLVLLSTEYQAQCSTINSLSFQSSQNSFCGYPASVNFISTATLDTTHQLLTSYVSPNNFQQAFSFSFNTVNNGCNYYLQISGSVALWGNQNHLDGYSKFNTNTNLMYVPSTGLSMFLSPVADIPPTVYNPLHIYDFIYFGDGSTAIFNFTDFPYWDNFGTVNFDWYAIPCFHYHWDFGDGQNSTQINPAHTYNGSGSFEVTLTVTDSLSNCSESFTDTIEVFDPPLAAASGLLNQYCISDASSTLNGLPTGGTFSGPGITGNIFNPSLVSPGGALDILYSFTDANGCSDTDTMNTIVYDDPQVSLSGLLPNYCADAPVSQLNGIPGGGTFSGPGVVGNLFNPSLTNPGGPYNIIYGFIDVNGCSNSDTLNTIVYDNPQVELIGLETDYCSDASVVSLTASPVGGNFSGQGMSDNIFNPSIPVPGGPYYMVYEFIDLNGCSGSDSLATTIHEIPQVNIYGLASDYCADDSEVQLFGNPEGGDWSGDGIENEFFLPAEAPVDENISITYFYIDGFGCSNSASVETTVHPIPEPTLGRDTTICYPDFITLNPGEFHDYQWQDNNGDSYYIVKDPGSYWVKVSDEFGCVNRDTVLIYSNCIYPFYVPNAFTPNGDGINDFFQPIIDMTYIEHYELTVMDRWGEIIFKTEDHKDRWDGSFGPTYVPAGTYIWTLEIMGHDGVGLRSFTPNGTVNVIR